jgi:hypothetical protein
MVAFSSIKAEYMVVSFVQINNLAKEVVAQVRHLRRYCKDFNKQLKKHCTNERPCPPQENKTY